MHSTSSRPTPADGSESYPSFKAIARSVVKHSFGVAAALITYAVSGFVLMGEVSNAKSSDPGWFPEPINFLVITFAQYLAIALLYDTFRGRKLRRAVYSMTLYYLLVIFVMQLETLYFRSELLVPMDTVVRLFVFGLPFSIIIPMYLSLFPVKSQPFNGVEIISGSGVEEPLATPSRSTRHSDNALTTGLPERLGTPVISQQFLTNLQFIVAGSVLYVVLYLLAGYYLAWVHEDVRSFYGSTGDLLPFHQHLNSLLINEPSLLVFQLARGWIWSMSALIILRETRDRSFLYSTALLCFLLSIPQNIAHIGSNPILTESEVRHIHLIETVSSMILFGFFLSLMYRKTPMN